MTLTTLDWAFIAIYFVASAAIGLWYAGRGGKSVNEFFLTGRSLPWWLAGTSMVATTFAADTPLGRRRAWSHAMASPATGSGGARRSAACSRCSSSRACGVAPAFSPTSSLPSCATAGGPPRSCAAFARCIWPADQLRDHGLGQPGDGENPGRQSGWDQLTAVFVSLAITGIYSALSGLWGVVVTDFFQFIFAMTGSIALAWFALQLPAIGGLAGLSARKCPPAHSQFVPSFSASDPATAATIVGLPLATFLTYVCVQWWASWYPGQEPGGGGYVAQRMMSAKDERHSLLATLWFTVAHYCLRPWPWIIVGLVSIVLYPGITDKESGYVLVMRDHLPPGLARLSPRRVLSPPTCRRSRRNSIGARRTSSTTSIGAS